MDHVSRLHWSSWQWRTHTKDTTKEELLIIRRAGVIRSTETYLAHRFYRGGVCRVPPQPSPDILATRAGLAQLSRICRWGRLTPSHPVFSASTFEWVARDETRRDEAVLTPPQKIREHLLVEPARQARHPRVIITGTDQGALGNCPLRRLGVESYKILGVYYKWLHEHQSIYCDIERHVRLDTA